MSEMKAPMGEAEAVIEEAALVLRKKWNLWPADARRMAADLHRAGLLTAAGRDATLRERAARTVEALPGPNGEGLAMWTNRSAADAYLLAIEEAAAAIRALGAPTSGGA